MINKGMKASNQLQDPVIPHGGNGPAHPYLSAIDPTTQSYVYAEYGYPDHAPYVPAPTPGYSNNDVVSQIRQQPVVPEKLVPITMETLKSKLINRLEDFKVCVFMCSLGILGYFQDILGYFQDIPGYFQDILVYFRILIGDIFNS